VDRADQAGLVGEWRGVWVSQDPCCSARPGQRDRQASGRPADGHSGPSGRGGLREAPQLQRREASGGDGKSARSSVQPGPVESRLGHGHHHDPALRGLAVSDRGPRSVLAGSGGLINALADAGRPGTQGGGHGGLEAKPRAVTARSLGSGQPVLWARVAEVHRRQQARMLDEPPRQLPGRCGCRELFPTAEARTDQAGSLYDSRRSTCRFIRLVRAALQPPATARFQWWVVAGRLR